MRREVRGSEGMGKGEIGGRNGGKGRERVWNKMKRETPNRSKFKCTSIKTPNMATVLLLQPRMDS